MRRRSLKIPIAPFNVDLGIPLQVHPVELAHLAEK
jgi:hypothetical protein